MKRTTREIVQELRADPGRVPAASFRFAVIDAVAATAVDIDLDGEVIPGVRYSDHLSLAVNDVVVVWVQAGDLFVGHRLA